MSFSPSYLEYLSGPFESENTFNLTIVRNNGRVAMGVKQPGNSESNLTGRTVFAGGKEQFYLGSEGVYLLPQENDATREIVEETGLVIPDHALQKVGLLLVEDGEDGKDIAVFIAETDQDNISDSRELAGTRWCPEDAIPYDETPADYRYWVPHVLDGYVVTAFIDATPGKELSGVVVRIHPDDGIPGDTLPF